MSPKKAALHIPSIAIALLAVASFAQAADKDRDNDHRSDRDDRRDDDRDDDHRGASSIRLAFFVEPSSSGVAGQALGREPWVVAVNPHGIPVFGALRNLSISAYLDPSCTSPAPGTLSGAPYPFLAVFGFGVFHDVTETLAQKIYIKASASGVASACSSPVSFSAGDAHHLIAVSGDGQSGPAGASLSQPAQIKVVDAFGNTVGGAAISFTSTAGGGSASPETATTNASGVASAALTLGPAPGLNLWSAASVRALKGKPSTITLSATALGSTSSALALNGPSSQQAGACSSSFTVNVVDKNGQPVKAYSPQTVSVTGLGGGGLYGDSGCSNSISAVTIPAGSSSATFYVKDTKVEVLAISTSAQGLASSQTVSDSVIAGPGSRLVYVIQPSDTAVAGQAFAAQPSIRVLDAYGNAASSGSYSVTLTPAQDVACQTPASGTLRMSASPVATSSGSATFAGVNYTLAGSVYLQASASGLTPACSRTVTVSAAGPSVINVMSGDAQSAPVGTTLPTAPTVQVTDAFGNIVSGASLSFAVASGGGSVNPATGASDASGKASVSMVLGRIPGDNVLNVSGQGSAWGSTPATVAVHATAVAGAPATLAFTGPSSLQAGGCSPAFSIALSDSYGNSTTASSALTIHLAGQGAGAFYADASCAQAVGAAMIAAGSGTQQVYFRDTAAESVTLAADGSAAGLNTGSVAVSVAPAAASKLVFQAQPTGSANAGDLFGVQPAVALQDSFGNLVSSVSDSVTLAAFADAACSAPAPAAIMTSANPVTTSGGVAAFAGVGYPRAGTIYVQASSGVGLAPACSGALNISAAAPDHLIAVAGDAQSASVGQPVAVAPQVRVVDAFGNTVSGVALTFVAASGGGTAGSPSVSTDGAGLASSSFTLGTTPGANTLVVRSAGQTFSGSPSTLTFTETAVAGAPAVLALGGPASQAAGQCSQVFSLSLKDSYGNAAQAVSDTTVNVTGAGSGAFYSDAACASAVSSVTIGAGSGSGSFFVRDVRAESLALSASAAGLSQASQALLIQPGAASGLAFVAQPSSSAVAGQALAQSPKLAVRDSFGNTVIGASSPVTLAAYADASCSSPATGTLRTSANPVQSAADGTASFAGVSYTSAGTIYLGASSQGLSSACSTAVGVSAAAADHLIALQGDGQSGSVGQTLPVSPQVRVVDAFANPVAGFAVAFSVSAGGGSVASSPVTSDANGVASTAYTLGSTPGNHTLTAQAATGSLPGSPAQVTFNATATPAAPASLVLSGPVAQGAGACSAAFTIALKDRYGNPAQASSATSISLGGAGAGSFFADAACSGASSSVTVASGAGSATAYFKDGRAENLILTASASGLTSSSLPFTVQAGTPAVLAIVAQPSSSGVAGQALAQQPQIAVRDSSGNLVSKASNAVALAAFSDSTCSTPASGTLAAASNPVTPSDGTAAFAGVSETLAGTIYLGFSANGLTSACSNAVQISAGAPAQLIAVQGDGQSAVAGSALAVNPTIRAIDANGNLVSGASISFAVVSGGGSVNPASASTDTSGLASTQFTLGTAAGSNTLTAALASQSQISVTFNETGTSLPPVRLLLTGPAPLTAGACSPAFTVQLMDSNSSATPAASDTLVSLSGAGHGAFYADAACTQAITAVTVLRSSSSSQLFVMDRTAETLDLLAQSSGLASSGERVSVSAAAASKLVFAVQPSSSGVAGQALAAQPVLQAQDAFGNSASSFGGSVALAAFTDAACSVNASGTLTASSNPVTASSGQAAFAGVAYGASATVYLRASSGGLSSACSSAVVVSPALTLVAGTSHTCALKNGDVQCWGFNGNGALGNNSTTTSAVPVQVAGLASGGIALGAGGQHSCAATSTGMFCWGLNGSGQLGNGNVNTSLVPVSVAGISAGVTEIVAGDSHTCALINGGVKCWGSNSFGQLGVGNFNDSLVPIQVQGLPGPAKSIAAASGSTCAVMMDGTAYCWGYNDYGQLGNGTTQNTPSPTLVQGVSNITTIAPGIEHTCALVSGAVYCWGSNLYGQLGNGNYTNSTAPQLVAGLTSGVTKLLSGGQNFNCAIINAGSVQCWGQNIRGQLGDNKASGNQSSTPVQVLGLTSGYQVLHAGYVHACASDGNGIKCWGWGKAGQLGNGSLAESDVPVSVVGY
jgi:alpha-tubulin suppressor-like RCC1 family protein